MILAIFFGLLLHLFYWIWLVLTSVCIGYYHCELRSYSLPKGRVTTDRKGWQHDTFHHFFDFGSQPPCMTNVTYYYAPPCPVAVRCSASPMCANWDFMPLSIAAYIVLGIYLIFYVASTCRDFAPSAIDELVRQRVKRFAHWWQVAA